LKKQTSEKNIKPVSGIPTVIAAIIIQIMLGVAYIWSVFQDGIAQTLFSGTDGEGGMGDSGASLAFTLLLLMMTVGSIIGGKLALRFSIRRVVLAGGIIMSLGFFLSSLVTASVPWLLWLTYGIIGGTGMGFTYSTTIAAAQKWFPHKKGLITGLVVFGLGFGGIVFTPIVAMLIEAFGGVAQGEQQTFMVLSGIFLVGFSICSYFLKTPIEVVGVPLPKPDSAKKVIPEGVKQYSTTEMLKTPQYYMMFFAFFLACMTGVMMINFARPIAEARGAAEFAVIGVMAITVFNSVGRLFWGYISDKLGRHITIVTLLTGNLILSLLVNSVSGVWVFVLIACIGFLYGGIFTNFPPLTADLFGVKHLAANYGFVILGFGVGSVVAGQIVGHFANRSRDAVTGIVDMSAMFPAFIIAASCSAVAIVLMFVLRSKTRANLQKDGLCSSNGG